MADKGWQRKFEDPILLPGRRKIVTLVDAGDYIANLPKKEADVGAQAKASAYSGLCSPGS